MARLQTKGFEMNTLAVSSPDGINLVGGVPTPSISTAQSRSGSRSLLIPLSSSGSGVAYFAQNATTQITYSWRSYVYFTSFPAAGSIPFAAVTTSADVGIVSARVDSVGALSFVNDVGAVTLGTATLSLNTWHRIEISIKIDTATAANATTECQVDGVSIGSTTGGLGTTVSNRYKYQSDSGGSGATFYVDDVALNDSTGTFQTSWPGSGKVVLLLPITDNARTGFTGGAGATASLFDAVNNTPPVGVADTGTDASQIRDAASSATDNYDANMATYSAAGLAVGDTVNLVQWIIIHSTASLTSIPARAGRLVSNPAEGSETTLAVPAVIAGTYPAGWTTDRGPITYNPSVTLGTAPVLRVGKRTASTRVVDVCFMGIYVDYTPGVPAPKPKPIMGANVAVLRAAAR